jgi:hypothetical protein
MKLTAGILTGSAILSLALSSVAISPAQAVGSSCASGGACAVGDVGPGGGTVFYVSASTFTCGPDLTQPESCNFLEAAGSEWIDTAANFEWSPISPATNVPGLTDTATATDPDNAIGSGLAATDLIVAAYGAGTNYAAGVARAFRNTSGTPQTDWYLPTGMESLQLCKYANTLPQGADSDPCTSGSYRVGFSPANQNGVYWTSSEFNAGEAWFEYFDIGGLDRVPKTGGLGQNRVRPIRAGLGVSNSSGSGIGGSGGSGNGSNSSGESASVLARTGSSSAGKYLVGMGALALSLAGAAAFIASRRVRSRRR